MSARPFFLIAGLLVAAMWIFAVATMPADDSEGRTVIAWSTDPNPARPGQIEPFHRMHPNILVRVEPNTFDRTIVQASTGVGPDLIEIYDQAQMVTLAEAGILLDLTPYAEEYGIGPEVTYPKLQGNLLYNGRQYRFPANVSSGVLFYNKKVFRDAGIEEPPAEGMTWQEYIELVRPLTVRRPDGRGYERFAMALAQSDAEHIHLQHGARIFSEDGTRCVLDSPESIAAMQFYIDLMHEHARPAEWPEIRSTAWVAARATPARAASTAAGERTSGTTPSPEPSDAAHSPRVRAESPSMRPASLAERVRAGSARGIPSKGSGRARSGARAAARSAALMASQLASWFAALPGAGASAKMWG